MDDISISVKKKDHDIKASGKAVYIADMKFEDMLYGVLVRSTVSCGEILQVECPVLPAGYFYIDAKDVPAKNGLKVLTSEQPVFAEKQVKYTGEAIAMIAGPDPGITSDLAARVKVTYKAGKPVLTIEDAKENIAEYHYTKGDPEKAFMEASSVYEETFSTSYQEQAYLEPQGAVGLWENGKITVYGSMQCPYYVKNAVMFTMGLDEDHVRIVQTVTGGAFGGKEDYPSLMGCHVAVAAKKCGYPVRLIYNRREDMSVTPKRHPALMKYRVALDRNGGITGFRADIRINGGAYSGLSSVVLQRAIIAACGAYRIDNLDVTGQAVITNTVPNGAYRGFGAPQAFFAVETLMNHLAAKLHTTPLDFRKKYIVRQGDSTSTNGCFKYHVPLQEMLEKAEEISSYSRRFAAYSEPQNGRYRKGIGLSLFFHGCGFTGSAEKDFIKSVIRMVKYKDDTVEIFAANTDMGQGLKTTFSKIASRVLGIPLDHIIINNPDTDTCPNSGPTVASRSLMIVGKLVERGAQRLKDEWVSGKKNEIVEHYKHIERIPWNMDTFQGDAYPEYSWGLNVIEVKLDTLLASTELTGVWGVYDVGKAIDTNIIIGQAEGGMLQGIGYGSMEKMEDKDGRIFQPSFTDYMIPTAKDTVPFKITLIDNPYEGGPFGAKGAGELTLIGGAPAYEAAVEQASGKHFSSLPLTPEKIMEAL